MVEAWRSGGVALLDSTGLARVFITSLLLFAIAIYFGFCYPSKEGAWLMKRVDED